MKYLFGKQKLQESILESWNQAKIPKDFADPLPTFFNHYINYDYQANKIFKNYAHF